jgi:hypothetical protein
VIRYADRKLWGFQESHVPRLREKDEVHSFEGLARRRAPGDYEAQAAAAQLAAFHEAAAQEAAAHEAFAQLAAFQEAAAQEAFDQEALAQEALFQEAFAQEAFAQEALFQEALFHDASVWAVLAQLAASKAKPPETSGLTNWFRARFGLGGSATCVAAIALTSPTPRAMPPAVGCALSMRAPLTLSGVQSGWWAMTRAAAPETTGAEKEVPDIHM